MKKIKKYLITTLVLGLSFSFFSPVKAEENVNLTIRSGNYIVFSGEIPLPDAGTVSLNDMNGNSYDVNSQSVLSIVNEADLISDQFEISNLTYFSSFGSLYLKCINHSQGEDCDNWQYVVNGSAPFLGMDQYLLSGGENIYVYFGFPNRIILDRNTIKTSETVTVSTENYDYENNNWTIRTGVTVGITTPDPSNPWSPIEIATSIVNENGKTTFSNIPEGIYNVGVKEDFYFPTLELIVEKNTLTSSGGHRNSSKDIVKTEEKEIKKKFDIKKAYDFLFQNQEKNGSWGEDIYTDWVTLAIIDDPDHHIEKIKIIKFLSENPIEGNLLTDIERRSMSLMAFGLSPYSTNNRNYIAEIVRYFDGTQFGDPTIDNDDIFALIVLQNAGFTAKDIEIKKTIEFVLKKQKENGSWDNSVDMTGAGINALTLFNDFPKVEEALLKAKEFLKKEQSINGGFGNVSSTAWAIEGIKSLGEKLEDWEKAKKTPIDYLITEQDTNGGIKNENLKNSIWETAYVLSALREKTWNEVLQDFKKQEVSQGVISKTQTTIKNQTKNISQDNKQKEEVLGKMIEIKEEIITEKKKKNWFNKVFAKIIKIFKPN